MPDEGRAAWFCRKAGDLKQGMYVLAVSILKNEADVEDAMQNALMQAYQHLDELRIFDKFRPWLFKILTNECYHILRERRYDEDIDEVTLTCPRLDADSETKMFLWETIQSLPEDYRTVIVLFYYEDMRISDIAQVLGASADTIKKRLSRARDKLRGLLDKEDFV